MSIVLMLGVVFAKPFIGSYALPTANTIWSSGFETGTFSEWNAGVQQDGGAAATVSSTFAYSGTHSSYHYNAGSVGSSKNAYPIETFSPRPSHFLAEVWIYVPSSISGSTVQFTDWVSFLSIWINQGYWQYANPITVDGVVSGGGSRQVTMNIYPLGGSYSNYHKTQQNPITWPLDQWWQLAIECDLHPGSSSTITVYQNGVSIISWTGNLGNTGLSGTVTYDGLSELHAGLYIGSNEGTFAIYNDAVTVEDLTSSSQTTTSSGSTLTSTSNSVTTSSLTLVSTTEQTSSTQTIGNPTSSAWGGNVYAWSFVASASGTVIKVGMDVSSTYSGNLMTGLYSDNSGSPGSLLSSSSSTAVVSGWNDLTLGTPVQIIAGTRYWMAVQFSIGTSSMRWYYDNSGSGVEVWQTYSSLPNPFGSASAIPILGNMRITYLPTTMQTSATTTSTIVSISSTTTAQTTQGTSSSIAATVNLHTRGTVTVCVLQGGGVISTQTYTTKGSHTFTFTGLAPGTYTVIVQVNKRMQQSKTVTVPPNAQVTFNF